MYHIGICDDDPVFIKYIERLFTKAEEEIKFYEYFTGEELIHDMQMQEKYDLLILDIQLPGMNGNEIAKEFRKQYSDTLLVFCSGVFLPTVESFETTPYRFWLKEYTEERMQKEVDTVFGKMKKTKVMPYLMGKRENQLVKLSPNQISYIAIAKKGTVLYGETAKEQYTSGKRLGEFYEQLHPFGFVYAHNSYIVNLKYVKVVCATELELVSGEKLTISRARAKEFKRAFAVSLAEKYEG